MKKLIVAFITIGLLLLSLSCSKSATTQQESYGRAVPTTATMAATTRPASMAPVPVVVGSAGGSNFQPPSETTQNLPAAERMIVRNGNIGMVVVDVPAAIDKIGKLAENMGGYIVASQTWPSGQAIAGSISVRVPSADFENGMKAIAALAVDVKTQSTSSKDVTQDYVDYSAQLANLQATEQQLLVIMQKADKVEDILAVQRELTNVRGNIERTKGYLQYLERVSSLSLIEVSLEQSGLSVDITVSRTVATIDEGIEFSADIAGGFKPFSYEWDFGDKSTSSKPVLTHSFRSAGDYTIKLRITDDRGSIASTERTLSIYGGWSGASVARTAWRSLVTLGKVIVNILIWLGIFSPVWIIGGGIGYFFWRRGLKKRSIAGPAEIKTEGSPPAPPVP